MSWIKDAKDSLIELGRAAGVLSTAEERATDVEVRVEENKTKIVELRKTQKLTWGKAASELKEMGVTQEDFDFLNSIDPFGETILPVRKKKTKPAAHSTDTNTDDVEVEEADVEVEKTEAEKLAG